MYIFIVMIHLQHFIISITSANFDIKNKSLSFAIRKTQNASIVLES